MGPTVVGPFFALMGIALIVTSELESQQKQSDSESSSSRSFGHCKASLRNNMTGAASLILILGTDVNICEIRVQASGGKSHRPGPRISTAVCRREVERRYVLVLLAADLLIRCTVAGRPI